VNGSPVFRHHWLAYWRSLVVIAGLTTLGLLTMGILHWPLLGVGLWSIALVLAVRIYLLRTWHTLTFTPDNRLIYRRGLFGSTQDVISILGTVTSHRTPLLSNLLDVGSVYLGVPGPDVHIRHIANFTAFYQRLCQARRPGPLSQSSQPPQPPPSIHLWIQLLPLLRLPTDHLTPWGPDHWKIIPPGGQHIREESQDEPPV